MSFQDCYKNFIMSYCDYTNWVGPTAKWIDQCLDSTTEDITIYEYIYAAKTVYFNNAAGTQKTCWPGYIGPHTLLAPARYVVESVATYLRDQKAELDKMF